MTASKTFRESGAIASQAVKAPCVVATAAAITLSGTQTVNGVAVVAGDRVLVKDQDDSSENGIYVASSSAWQRTPDFDGNRDAANGTCVIVAGVGLYMLSATNPVTIGTTELTFTAI